ncbi:MAG: V-type ATPase subunit [Anaerolineae bacterium]
MVIGQGVQAYSLVQATVRALYADLLSTQDWDALIQAPDQDAVLTFLSKTTYAPYLQIDRSLLTPRRTVYQIRWHLAGVYAKLIRISKEPGRSLLTQLWHHYEVDNIKGALRGVEAGVSWDQVLHLLYPMGKYIEVDVADLEKMVRAPSVARAVQVLQGTSYYDIMAHALTRYHEEQNLFPLEVALDLGYRRNLWESIDQLHGHDREMALRTVGTALDNDNLLWAIRYHVYHHMSEAEIVNYTLPLGYEVEDADIRAIARGEDVASVVFRIHPDLREQLQGVTLESGEGLGKLEEALSRLLLTRCRKMFIGSPFHIGLPLAYVWLNEYEIRDLTVVVEAKASGLSPDVWESMLLMPTL